MKFDEDTISEKIQKLGSQISENYEHKNLVVISILPNSMMFSADLLRCLNLNNVKTDVVSIKQKEDQVVFTAIRNLAYIKDRCVLVVDCVTKTGNTLSIVQERLLQFNPASIQSAVLFFKSLKFKGMKPAYIGFEIEDDKFLYGYGMAKNDVDQNKPFVQALPPKMIKKEDKC